MCKGMNRKYKPMTQVSNPFTVLRQGKNYVTIRKIGGKNFVHCKLKVNLYIGVS